MQKKALQKQQAPGSCLPVSKLPGASDSGQTHPSLARANKHALQPSIAHKISEGMLSKSLSWGEGAFSGTWLS